MASEKDMKLCGGDVLAGWSTMGKEGCYFFELIRGSSDSFFPLRYVRFVLKESFLTEGEELFPMPKRVGLHRYNAHMCLCCGACDGAI